MRDRERDKRKREIDLWQLFVFFHPACSTEIKNKGRWGRERRQCRSVMVDHMTICRACFLVVPIVEQRSGSRCGPPTPMALL
jgi:hypothetical protein